MPELTDYPFSLAEVIERKYGLCARTRQVEPNDLGPKPELEIFEWNHDSIAQPDEAQLALDFAEYQVYLDSVEYKKLRQAEYPSIQEQLDLMHKLGFDGWKAEMQIIKDKYPKPV